MAISVAKRNKIGDAASSGSLATTFASNTVHNAIIIIATTDGADTTLGAPTDTPGNTYVLQKAITKTTSFAMRCWATFDCLASAGTNTVTVNDNFHDSNLFIFEVSGLATSSAFDKSASADQTSATSLSSGNTATTTNANELLIGITCNTNAGTLAPTLGSGYSNLQTLATAFNNGASEEQIVAATAAYAGTFGLAANSDNETTAVFTFSDTSISSGPTAATDVSMYKSRSGQDYQPYNLKPIIETY